jgi:hypothetical protein
MALSTMTYYSPLGSDVPIIVAPEEVAVTGWATRRARASGRIHGAWRCPLLEISIKWAMIESRPFRRVDREDCYKNSGASLHRTSSSDLLSDLLKMSNRHAHQTASAASCRQHGARIWLTGEKRTEWYELRKSEGFHHRWSTLRASAM